MDAYPEFSSENAEHASESEAAQGTSTSRVPMRVCFFIPSFGDGGAQRQCIGLLNALQHNTAVEAHVILLGRGIHDASLDVSRVTVHRIELNNFANPVALVFLMRTLHRVRPDILLSWLHPADIWAFCATRILRGLPWVMTERNSVFRKTNAHRVRKRIGGYATAIIANSRQGELLWRDLDPLNQTWVIPNMVLDQTADPQTKLDRAALSDLLAVGRLEPQKNMTAVAAAFGSFAVRRPDVRLLIAGQGAEESEIRRIAHHSHVAGRIELLGFRHDVPFLMSCARMLLSLSRHEGMPNVLMEAVAANLPAVVSDIPEHRELLGDDYPYYVRIDSTAQEAGEIIAQAWESGNSSEDIYFYARSRLTDTAPDKIAEQYFDVFSRILSVGGHGR